MLTEMDGKTTLLGLQALSFSSTVYFFQETSIAEQFKELSEFETQSALCEKIGASERYIALGCPSHN